MLTIADRKFGGSQKCVECEEIDENRPFCSYISSQDESGAFVLHLSAAGEKLFFQEAKDPLRQWELQSPSISLGRILESVSTNDLSNKMKEVLSWLLAKSVWQYYSSPWMYEPPRSPSPVFCCPSSEDLVSQPTLSQRASSSIKIYRCHTSMS